MAFAIAPAAPTQATSPTPFAPTEHAAAIGNRQHSRDSGPRHEWIDLHCREMGDMREADVSREFRAEKRDFAESGLLEGVLSGACHRRQQGHRDAGNHVTPGELR